MRRAQTIYSTFRSRSDRDRILLAETALKRGPSASGHWAFAFAMADFLFRCRGGYDRALENSQSHRPVCRIARLSSFSPATSIGAVKLA